MGYIKKLKNNELVGGTDKTTIYPVTSTKAVFEEVSENNFQSQESINEDRLERIETLEAHDENHEGRVSTLEAHDSDHENRVQELESVVPNTIKSISINGGTEHTVDETGNVDLTIYTVNPDDPDIPAMADLVEKNRDDIADIKEEIGTDTTQNTLSGRITELETLVGGNEQGSVNQRIEDAVNALDVPTATVTDSTGHVSVTLGETDGKINSLAVSTEDIASAEALNTLDVYVHNIEGGNIRVKTSVPTNPDTGAPANTVYRVAGTTTYSDYMWNGTTMVKMAEYNVDTLESQFGYYKWETASNTISITTSNQVAGSPIGSYVLTSGGSFKIKMTNKATGACTLNMNGTGVKTLLYNGDPVASSNTWENDEVISVYYDGTNYQASNAQGGGGKAEKIKYDNAQSGFAADNVQEALDEVAQLNDLRNIGLLNIHFDGKGTAYAESNKFYGVARHILKFTLVEQNVPYDSIASAQSRFMIYSHDANDVETTLYRVNGTNLPDKEIVVYVPDDSVCLYIGGRCSRGYKYECKVVDITCEYENTIITENDLYYHLASSPEYKYRINLLLPYQNNAVVKIRPKISTPTYQYEIDGVVINNDKTTTTTILINYSNTQIDYVFKGGYSYIIVFFKKGNNLEVDKSELLSEYDINVEYPETIEELKIADGDKKWDLIGLSKISNAKAKTDFIVLPNLPMRVKMDIPIWMKVSFTTGNRTNRVDLGTYYSGDIVDFSQGSAGVFVGFQRLDDRGFDADFYTRHSKFLGMSLTQIGSNDGNIFERNYDNEKNLGGIMATGPQSIQRFPTIVHVSDAHGDSFRLNAAHDYADYILADLVINTGDNPFFEMKDGVNFVKDIVFSHKTDFANCIGNHDQYTSTLADVFSKNISPFATEYGYHKSTASDITDKCYYYKDLSAQKIRIIVLDVYDGLVYQAYKARISQEQINWFVSTLAATPQDYGVIVVSHQAPHTINAISGKENFNDVTMEPQINALDSDYMRNGKITGNPLGKIIDAFIVKGSVSGSYTQKKVTSSTNETISYSADFSNVASGVEFIAYINGHTHRDFIGYVADCENNQLNCNVCSTSPLSQTTGYGDKSDIYRDANGVAQDAFNVYTIDRYNHRVGVCRIGSNLSLNLIDRKVMWFSYR